MRTIAICPLLGMLAVAGTGCGGPRPVDSSQGGGQGGSGSPPEGTSEPGGNLDASITSILVGQDGDVVRAADVQTTCDSIHLDTASTPPRVVFIQDVSSSMSGQWRPLYDAMVAIAQQFGDEMQLGLIPFASVYFDHVTEIKSDTAAQFQTFFSAHDNDCSISDSAIIAPAPDNAAKIIAQYDSVDSSRMVGGTPTYAAISKAREVLVDKAPKDGSPGYVILVTDGAPNCTSPTSDQIGDVRTAVSSLASLGVNTYVVGYNYTGAALDQWASAGNTSKYFNANDTSKLITAISGILTGLLPCEYSLSASVDKPTYVRVSVDGKDRPFNGPTDGWTLGADSKTITLTGAACTDLRSPGHHSVNVFVECSEVVIL